MDTLDNREDQHSVMDSQVHLETRALTVYQDSMVSRESLDLGMDRRDFLAFLDSRETKESAGKWA